MGSCISKCIPKNSSLHQEVEDGDHVVHVKHAIISSTPEKPLVSPSFYSASITSFSSSSTSTSNSGYSISSSSSKDFSFSNEFLRACAKENQHLIVLKPSNKGGLERQNVVQRQNPRPYLSSPPTTLRLKPSSPRVQVSGTALLLKPSSPRMQVSGSTPKKRARANSPILTRQKSFRNDNYSTTMSTCHLPNRALRSPSPTRRFTADVQGKMENSTFRQGCVLKGSIVNSASPVVRKENFKPATASPSYQPRRADCCSKGNTVNSEVYEGGNEEVQARKEMDTMLVEDINNPHISLDCFIFL